MRDDAMRLPAVLSVAEPLADDFQAHLREVSTLAFRVAYSVLRHREDAEDVAQEALVKAYRSVHQLRDRERLRAWLVRMTWRMALNRQRSNRRAAAHLAGEVDTQTVMTPAELLASRERAEQLWRAIDALPDKLRLVVVLAGIQEHDLREVALLLRLPEGTVKSRLFLARKRLKELLQWTSDDPTRRAI